MSKFQKDDPENNHYEEVCTSEYEKKVHGLCMGEADVDNKYYIIFHLTNWWTTQDWKPNSSDDKKSNVGKYKRNR